VLGQTPGSIHLDAAHHDEEEAEEPEEQREEDAREEAPSGVHDHSVIERT
jgi:hypothetical protein